MKLLSSPTSMIRMKTALLRGITLGIKQKRKILCQAISGVALQDIKGCLVVTAHSYVDKVRNVISFALRLRTVSVPYRNVNILF